MGDDTTATGGYTSDYTAATYGDRIADVYDELVPTTLDTDMAVATLVELAGTGPVLELGIGTGRLALPLAARGIQVQGIDASEAMVAKLRAKRGGDAIHVTIGDFADVPVDGTFPLVFIAFNTLFALLSQEAQVRCFANVAPRLADGGVFAVEAFVPDLALYNRNQRLFVMDMDTSMVRIDAGRIQPSEQQVEAMQIVVSEERTRLFPVRLRYAWPAELDLMARLAGLRLLERWGDWDRRPFDDTSTRHVSVYGG
jgi:SAM-dependent methyltransferase